MLRRIRDKLRAKSGPVDDRELMSSFHAFQEAAAIERSRPLSDCQLVAIDFETSGLNARRDQILSIGICPFNINSIRISDCTHLVVNQAKNLTDSSVTIHGLTHDQVAQGISDRQALLKLLNFLCGRILVCHFHRVEHQFLQALAKRLIGKKLQLNMLDTFWLAKRQMQMRQQAVTPHSLRLANLRKKYSLSPHPAHNALEDAIATAELFIAQICHISKHPESLRLKDLDLFVYRR